MNQQEIASLDNQYFLNVYGPRFPVCFVRGEKNTLYDETGKGYVDFLAGIAVNSLGYGYPSYVQALQKQVAELIHCSSLFYIQPQAELAQLLVEKTMADRVFFCNSGAEANEGAAKMARKYFYNKGEDRYQVISLNNSFHGRTIAMVAATGQEKYQKPYKPMLPHGFINVDAGDLDALKAAYNENTCAILLETIQGEGGVVPLGMEYLQAVESFCREKGILLIIDEVQTGMGRTGKLFSYEHFGLNPDIVTTAKGLGGGVPIGALLAREPAASAFNPGDHGTTFGGNLLASRAALAVLDALYGDGLLDQCAATGEHFRLALDAFAQKKQSVAEVRGLGLMLGMELKENVSARNIASEMLTKGFVIGTAARNTLRFVPPLTITVAEIDAMLETLDSVLS